jgi:hypothetical protein
MWWRISWAARVEEYGSCSCEPNQLIGKQWWAVIDPHSLAARPPSANRQLTLRHSSNGASSPSPLSTLDFRVSLHIHAPTSTWSVSSLSLFPVLLLAISAASIWPALCQIYSPHQLGPALLPPARRTNPCLILILPGRSDISSFSSQLYGTPSASSSYNHAPKHTLWPTAVSSMILQILILTRSCSI